MRLSKLNCIFDIQTKKLKAVTISSYVKGLDNNKLLKLINSGTYQDKYKLYTFKTIK